jgi:hypothetical protein
VVAVASDPDLRLALGVLLACGPSAAASSGDGGSTSGAPGGSESIGAIDSSSSSEGTEATAADPSAESTSTTGAPVDCASWFPPCPAECTAVAAYASDDWECVSTDNVDLCIDAGRQLDAEYASAWWKEIDGQPWILLSGHACRQAVEREPIGWTECSGTGEEPSACACLCRQGMCTGDIDTQTLMDCQDEVVCPPASAWIDYGITPEMQCVFEGLRDRVPGTYRVTFDGPNDDTEMLLLVAADGSVQVTRWTSWINACPTVLNGHWRPFRTCRLASTDLFAQCAAHEMSRPWPDGCQADSFTLSPWIEDCVDERLTCP